MRILKLSLSFFLVIHVFIALATNFSDYKIFSESNYIDRLNEFGKKLVNITPVNEVGRYTRPCTTFMGTERGYSFFSPNVSRSSVEMVFVGDDGKEIHIPFNSAESRLKFSTTDSYLESYLVEDEEIRDKIIKSLAKWMFAYNTDLSSIKVYINLLKYNNLYAKDVRENHVQEKRFFGFTIKRTNLDSYVLQ